MTGTIIKLFTVKGYGFISADGDGADAPQYFFFAGSLERTTCAFAQVKVGQRVEFTGIDHQKGLRAIEVRTL